MLYGLFMTSGAGGISIPLAIETLGGGSVLIFHLSYLANVFCSCLELLYSYYTPTRDYMFFSYVFKELPSLNIAHKLLLFTST